MIFPIKESGYDSASPPLRFFENFFYFYQKRELLFLLVSKELKSRYRRSLLGLLWTLINPMVSSIVLWLVFVSVFKSKLSNGTQFAPYLLAGVLTITFFNQGLMQAAESISAGARLFLKIRVDPVLFSLASALSNAVNFFFGLIALVIVSLISKAQLTIGFFLVIIVCFCLTIFSSGLGLIFAILFIRFDDTKYILTILLQLLTYLTPVFYPQDILDSQARIFVSLNPITSFLDVFRHVVNGTEVATFFDWSYMISCSFLTYAFGIFVFRRFWSKTVVMM